MMMASELARRAEEFWTIVSREQYRALAGIATRPALAAVYARYADLFAEETLVSLAEAERAETGAAARRLRSLREFLVSSHAEQAVAPALDERLAWEAEARLEAAGVSVSFRQASAALANLSDRERRWALEDERLGALRATERIDRARFEAEWSALRAAGGADYLESWEALSGIALAPLADAVQRLLADTSDLYHELLASELECRLGLAPGNARAVDRLPLERAPWCDALFDAADPVAVARRHLAELAFELEADGRIHLDLEARPAKWARPFCSPIRVPDEVVLVLSATGGARDWYGFFHELGHAQHFARVAATLPFEHRVLGDISVTEAYARLFERLTADPVWLRRYLGVGGAALHDWLRATTLLDLLRLRRQAGKLLYELELHGAGRFEGMPERYAEVLTQATGLRHDPAAYLDDVDPHLYCARYLRAWALEAQLAETLRDRFDEDWFRNPQSGPFLEELFAAGQPEAEAVAARLDGVPAGAAEGGPVAALDFERVRRRLEERVG